MLFYICLNCHNPCMFYLLSKLWMENVSPTQLFDEILLVGDPSCQLSSNHEVLPLHFHKAFLSERTSLASNGQSFPTGMNKHFRVLMWTRFRAFLLSPYSQKSTSGFDPTSRGAKLHRSWKIFLGLNFEEDKNDCIGWCTDTSTLSSRFAFSASLHSFTSKAPFNSCMAFVCVSNTFSDPITTSASYCLTKSDDRFESDRWHRFYVYVSELQVLPHRMVMLLWVQIFATLAHQKTMEVVRWIVVLKEIQTLVA